MADFPNSIFAQREIQNVPGQVYDPTKKTRVYADDMVFLGDEITAVENYLLNGPATFDRIVYYHDEIVICNDSMVII